MKNNHAHQSVTLENKLTCFQVFWGLQSILTYYLSVIRTATMRGIKASVIVDEQSDGQGGQMLSL